MNAALPRCTCVVGDELVPLYIDASDRPWVQALCDVVAELGDCAREHVDARLACVACEVAPSRRALALDVIHSSLHFSTRTRLPSRMARHEVFRRRVTERAPREEVLRSVAVTLTDQLGYALTARDIDDALFADVPAQHRLTPIELDADDVITLANQRLVRGVVARSLGVEVIVQGNARSIVRYAKLRGLILNVTTSGDASSFRMAISGPLAICQRTTMYGRALGDLLPQLSWCTRFTLAASIAVGEQTLTFKLATGAPIAPSKRPRVFDSLLERRFSRDLAKHATDWLLIREAAPIDLGTTLVFPDFLLRHRIHAEISCPIEIIGFWTSEYLERKLATYRDPLLARTIICVDERLGCDARAFPASAHVVPFKRGRIPIESVLRAARALCNRPAAKQHNANSSNRRPNSH